MARCGRRCARGEHGEHPVEALSPGCAELGVLPELVVAEVEGVREPCAVGRLAVGEAEVGKDAPEPPSIVYGESVHLRMEALASRGGSR